MNVLVGRFEIHIPWAQSLKDKRTVVRSLRGRIREHFEVACSEVALQELHQRAVMAVAAVGPDRVPLEALWEKLTSFVESNFDGELVSQDSEIVDYSEEVR